MPARYSQDTWLAKAREIHKGFYQYDRVIYIKSNKEVLITCPNHGVFPQLPVSHLQGYGCNKCGIIKSRDAKILEDEDILAELRLIHPNFVYSGVLRKRKRLFVEGICDRGHNIMHRTDHARAGHGCDKCCNNYSKFATQCLMYCSVRTPDLKHGLNGREFIPPGSTRVDGYSQKDNTIIECHGGFWHGDPRIYQHEDVNPRTKKTFGEAFARTQAKTIRLRELGYKVFEIWELDWNKGKLALTKLQRAYRTRKKAQALV